MTANETTLWIALPDGRAARVRVSIVDDALPVPLEVERSSRPSPAELAGVIHALGRGEYEEKAPIDPGLPPVSALIKRERRKGGDA